MTYLTSDIHGKFELLMKLLNDAGFSNTDKLYILGDVIDRWKKGGIDATQWVMKNPNVRLLKGNHEYMMECCKAFFVTSSAGLSRDPEKLVESWDQWQWNGSDSTIRALRKLDQETIKEIFEFIGQLPLYEEITVNGRDFLLVHAGLGNFRPERKLNDYSINELVWHRPKKDERYWEDRTVILGHTPTGCDFGKRGKMFRTDTWIDIDTGAAAMGGSPMLLRLEDMREFYI